MPEGTGAPRDGVATGITHRTMDAATETMTARIAELELRLRIANARSSANLAMASAFRGEHPDSPLLGDSGERFRCGDRKTRSRRVWEDAFDRALRTAGIADPLAHRTS